MGMREGCFGSSGVDDVVPGAAGAKTPATNPSYGDLWPNISQGHLSTLAGYSSKNKNEGQKSSARVASRWVQAQDLRG